MSDLAMDQKSSMCASDDCQDVRGVERTKPRLIETED